MGTAASIEDRVALHNGDWCVLVLQLATIWFGACGVVQILLLAAVVDFIIAMTEGESILSGMVEPMVILLILIANGQQQQQQRQQRGATRL
jgi:hypothetical protein